MPCADCGMDTHSLGMDFVLPRAQCLLIWPADGGVLCPNCIVYRANLLPDAVNVTGLITFGRDYAGEVTPYHRVSALARQNEHLDEEAAAAPAPALRERASPARTGGGPAAPTEDRPNGRRPREEVALAEHHEEP